MDKMDITGGKYYQTFLVVLLSWLVLLLLLSAFFSFSFSLKTAKVLILKTNQIKSNKTKQLKGSTFFFFFSGK